MGCSGRDCESAPSWSTRCKADRSGQIFGSPDDLKLRSSMTLFARATEDNEDFVALLDKYYDGQEDRLTVERLAGP